MKTFAAIFGGGAFILVWIISVLAALGIPIAIIVLLVKLIHHIH